MSGHVTWGQSQTLGSGHFIFSRMETASVWDAACTGQNLTPKWDFFRDSFALLIWNRLFNREQPLEALKWMNCWFRAGCLILSNCLEMAGKKSMSSFAARAAISLPIALFSCPYFLHYFKAIPGLGLKKSFKQIAYQKLLLVSYLCPLWHLLPWNFFKKPFNPCLLYLNRSQGRNLKYLFHRFLWFMPRSPRTWRWSLSCWCGQLWVYNAYQQYCFVFPWVCVQTSKTSISDQQLQKKAGAI